MVLALRNAVQNTGDFSALVAGGPSDVIRYAPESPDDPQTASTWQLDTLTYPVGQSPERRDGSGGVALQYAYKSDGSLDLATCGGTLVASGDVLNPQRTVHGLQIGEASGFQAAAGANIPTAFVPLDPTQDDVAARGHAGGVAVLSQCEGGGGFPPVASQGSQFPGVAGNGGGGGGKSGFPGVENGGGGGQTGFPGVENGGGGGQPTFPPVDGGGGQTQSLTLAKTAAVPKCSPDGGCAFNIEVTNNGPEVPGPITINELIEAPQAALTGEPDAPWQCSKAAPFTCTHPGPVPANGKLSMRVVFAPHTAPEAKELKNCASIAGGAAPLNNKLPEPGAQPAGQNQPGAPQAGQNQAQAPACATIPLDPNAPVQTGPVIISKKGPASCPIIGPCTFEITLTNTTDAAVPGPIPFTDTLDIPGAKLSDAPIPAPFSCKGGPPVNCAFGSANQGLGPHESKTFPLTFNLDLPDGTTSLKNCAVRPAAPAPQKKAELTAPMSLRPPMTEASFRPQLFTNGNGLLQFIDNPGGNIGGVNGVAKDCTQWGVKNGGFVVRQDNNLTIRFGKLQVAADGTVTAGQATYFPSNGGAAISGTVTGTISGNRFILNVKWKVASGDTGNYRGTIGADGQVTGTHFNKDGVFENFVNEGNWWICKRSKFCEDYAKGATSAASALAAAGCKAPDPASRWSPDTQAHIDFCMARASTVDPLIEAENKARADELASCAVRNKNREACAAKVKDLVATNEEMKALKCAEAIPNLTLESGTNVCLLKPGSMEAAKPLMQKQLADCKARLGVLDNAAPGAGGAGGANAGGQAQEPAPEQCAVVAIKDITPPGGGGKVTPKPQPSNAGPLSLVKTFGNNACVENRCTFNVTISNTTDAEVKGPIEFTDDVTGDGGLFNSATVSAASDPKFDCAKQGQGFVCSNPSVTLAAKSSVSITLTADLGKGVGAVKEMKNCATLKGAATPSCATAPLGAQAPAPAPAPAPAQPKNLALANNPAVAQCSDTGGGCAFITSLSNPANAPEFNGPVSFVAHLSQPDGSAFPNITMEDGGQALPLDGVTPSIFCKKDGNDVTCTAKALKIPPGKSVQIPMTFKPGGGTVATSIKSCASLAGGEKSCANIPLVKGPLLRAQKFTAAGSCVPSCAFAISLKNVGTDAATGPFVITEDFKPLNGDTTIETIDGDFHCFPTAVPSFGCISNAKDKLEPGESLSGRVLIKTRTVSPTYTNCIDYNPAANGKPSPFDKESAGRCVTITDTAHQGANLMVGVIAPNAGANGVGECSINRPCRFTVRITSNGAQEFPGTALFGANVQPGTVEAIGNGPGMAMSGWICGDQGKANNLSCTNANVNMKMAPQTSVDAEVGVIAGATWKKNDTLTLCAHLNKDSNPNDNDACASVKLDPFNVKVTKTGDQACTLGSDCNFTIKLFNPGPIDHNAPVTISDKLSGLASAQIVSITPPLPCATQPTQIPFSCTSPGPVRLDLGAPEGSEFGPRNFKMVVRLPGNSPSKQFANCADVSDGVTSASDQSCQTVSLKPPVQTCQAGMILTNGTCACPPGTKWNGKTCSGEGTGGASMSKPITPEPAPGPGTGGVSLSKQPGSETIKVCPTDRPIGTYPNCCPQGTEYRDGKCRYTRAAPVEVQCKSGLVKDARTGKCIACRRGMHAEGNACVPDKVKQKQPALCPADRPVGTYPNCCPQGYEFARGKCRRVREQRQEQQDSCPADRPVGTYPNCCPQGYEFGRGKCRRLRQQRQEQQDTCPADRPVGAYPNCCPEGYVFARGICRPVREQRREQQGTCPPDRPNGIYPNCCPDGYQFNGRRCGRIRNQEPDQGNQPQQQQHDCPPGYRVLSKPNKYGAYCEVIPVEGPAPAPAPRQCTGGKVGPNCVCPLGMRENRDGVCVDSVN
jgi:hypothetical protein